MAAKLKDGYSLLHDGALLLADVERNGIRVDVPYYVTQSDHLQRRLDRLLAKMLKDRFIQRWQQRYGSRFNLNSSKQLSVLLYDDLKIQSEDGSRSTDKSALLKSGISCTDDLLLYRKLSILRNTFIAQILREQVDGFLHPFFGLHLVQTYRSQSDSPNFQNQPVRDPESGRIIRSGIVPRPGNMFTEFDFKGMELCSQCCYHKDPTMIKYLEGHVDGSKDLHWDQAAHVYLLDRGEPKNKQIRYQGKNGWVFPETYGDYYKNCAPGLWEHADTLALADGTPLKDHLRSVGIRTYDDFEHHLERLEHKFWYEWFPVFRTWRERWWDQYCRRGWFDLLTGFRETGLYDRNQTTNHPPQGTGFHLLLDTAIRLDERIRKESRSSVMVAQIHDSLLLDHPPEERDFLHDAMLDIVRTQLPEWYEWICVPLIVEVEETDVGGSWWSKHEVEL